MPSVRNSNVIREADHFRVRRIASISATIPAAVTVGWWIGPAIPGHRIGDTG